jgi:hypothetical protein
MNDTNMNHMPARSILIEAMRRRIRLTPNGKTLVVDSVGELPQDFAEILKANKAAVLKLLNSKHHLARQIMLNEFDGADATTWHSCMELLLENYYDPKCKQALEYLRSTSRHIH